MAINDSPAAANPRAWGVPGHAGTVRVTFGVTFKGWLAGAGSPVGWSEHRELQRPRKPSL